MQMPFSAIPRQLGNLRVLRLWNLERIKLLPTCPTVPTRRRLIYTRLYHSNSRPTHLRLPANHHSLLPLVLSSSNLRLSPVLQNSATHYQVSTRRESGIYGDEEPVVPFFVSTPMSPECKPIGFLRPEVLHALKIDHETQLRQHHRSPWDLQYTGKSDRTVLSIAFAQWINAGGQPQRTQHMERLVMEWRNNKLFSDILRGRFFFMNESSIELLNHILKAGVMSPIQSIVMRPILP